MMERGHISLLETVFWYMSPQSGQVEESMPHRMILKYEWQHSSKPSRCPVEERRSIFTEVEDEVWAKLPKAYCTSWLTKGKVTAVNSKINISMNGILHHILDVCRSVT